MKKHHLLALAAVLAALCLAACGRSETPSWETMIPTSGAQLTFAGCDTEEQSAAQVLLKSGETVTAAVYACSQRPFVTVSPAAPENVTLGFVEPTETGGGYAEVETIHPLERLDYRCAPKEEGLRFRIDTIYDYLFTVKSDDGSAEYFLILCGGREAYQ